MTRFWVSVVPVEVRLDAQGMPLSLRWEGRWHAVQELSNHWRVDWGAWRVRVWRDYYKILTRSGLLLVLYHDRIGEGWYVQRIYD